ncbi:MAG: P-II family nitrogen regulator [Desulfomonile tiedjei]|nr:P-II family nitrogen regulator [Desulfomonile tiedjei]
MILIEAFIKPFKLDDIREALEELGVGGMTVTEVLQTAAAATHGRSFGAPGTSSDLVPKVKIEMAVPDRLVERVIEAICLHGSAGKREDGKIVAKQLHGAIRIRTGDEGEEALSF